MQLSVSRTAPRVSSASTSRVAMPIIPGPVVAQRPIICMAAKLDVNTPDEEWRKILSPAVYQILRLKGTEPPGSGEHNKNYKAGTYSCAGCGTPLFTSEMKFDSGCGWPAFFDEMPGSIKYNEDVTFGMRRVEIVCKNCDGHLGHVFENEGFPNPTNKRHCVNSLSIKFEPK